MSSPKCRGYTHELVPRVTIKCRDYSMRVKTKSITNLVLWPRDFLLNKLMKSSLSLGWNMTDSIRENLELGMIRAQVKKELPMDKIGGTLRHETTIRLSLVCPHLYMILNYGLDLVLQR